MILTTWFVIYLLLLLTISLYGAFNHKLLSLPFNTLTLLIGLAFLIAYYNTIPIITPRFKIYLLLLLIIFFYGVLNLKRLSTPFKILTLLIGMTFLSEYLGRLSGKLFKSSAPSDYYYAMVEFMPIANIFYYLSNNRRFKHIILIIIPLFILAEIFTLLYFQTLFEFPSVLLSIQELIGVILPLFYFREMLLNPIEVPLYKQSVFWLNTALFLYSAIMFLCFGLMRSLIVNQIGTETLSAFMYGVNMAFYGFLWFSIYIETKNKVSV